MGADYIFLRGQTFRKTAQTGATGAFICFQYFLDNRTKAKQKINKTNKQKMTAATKK